MIKKQTLLIALLSIYFSFGQAIDSPNFEKLTSAKKIVKHFVKTEQIPGLSISVSKNKELIWSEGFGVSNIETNSKVLPNNTQFRIASISKPLTAVALAKLMDTGSLILDESLYMYLPNYPKKKYDYTIRQIGGHLAGIRHYKGREFILNKKMTITEGLSIFKDDPLLFKPQSQFKYSTYGWNLLSEVIQTVAKAPFNDYMNSTIFNPLKMEHTTLDVSDSIMPNRTQFYTKTKKNKIVLGNSVSNEHKVAGGGFLSTTEDLIHFGNEVINPSILKKESLNEILKPQKTTSGKSTNYGVGFGISKTKKGTIKYLHSGGGIGASTILLIYPEEEIVIAILTNLSKAPVNKLATQLEGVFID